MSKQAGSGSNRLVSQSSCDHPQVCSKNEDHVSERDNDANRSAHALKCARRTGTTERFRESQALSITSCASRYRSVAIESRCPAHHDLLAVSRACVVVFKDHAALVVCLLSAVLHCSLDKPAPRECPPHVNVCDPYCTTACQAEGFFGGHMQDAFLVSVLFIAMPQASEKRAFAESKT